MTQIGSPVPILRKLTSGTVKPFVLELHHFEPRALLPIGDRYLVETIPVNDDVQFGHFQVAVRDPNMDPRHPMANPNVETRGVLPAVIIAAGDGHLLGLPDHAVAVNRAADESPLVSGVQRAPANVPMFFRPGDVALVDLQFKGRALKVIGREIRVVNQMDCLLKLPVRLVWTDDGWKKEGPDGQPLEDEETA